MARRVPRPSSAAEVPSGPSLPAHLAPPVEIEVLAPAEQLDLTAGGLQGVVTVEVLLEDAELAAFCAQRRAVRQWAEDAGMTAGEVARVLACAPRPRFRDADAYRAVLVRRMRRG